MKRLISILIASVSCLVACVDDQPFEQNSSTDPENTEGEMVQFTSSIPRTLLTRGVNSSLLSQYSKINSDYVLSIKMLEEGNDTPFGPKNYIPSYTTIGTAETPIKKYDSDGTLKAEVDGQGLRWQSNAKRYAFEATAGSETLVSDQRDPVAFFLQDRLHGYAYSPVTHPEGIGDDQIDAPNYHTSKEWFALNKEWHDTEGQMLASEDYKKIPLFLQHERAWITVILKAGKGVTRESVASLYDEQTHQYNQNVTTTLYSYTAGADAAQEILPLVGEKSVTYIKDANGEAGSVMNLKYDAYVEPHNYLEHPKDDKIAAINVAGMKFSFFASNDNKFSSTTSEDLEHMQMYNLTAGKHLTIEATLTSQRIVFLTAWIEDWDEIITSTICDDYGLNGDPTVITSREDLISFLTDPELNKAGNVAIVAATSLELDKLVTPSDTEGGNPTITDDPWAGREHQSYNLNATLNLAGATLRTNGRFLNSLSSTANLINGTIEMRNTTPVESAVANTNSGSIERITVTTSNAQASATRAGMVVTNHGSIIRCNNALPVDGVVTDAADPYIGGIAAYSTAVTGGSSPLIEGCTVTSRVKGAGDVVRGGGIVGQAEGRLTNNTFVYGITLLQPVSQFQNIVFAVPDGKTLVNPSGNNWPTIAVNNLAGANNSSAKYDNVLDSWQELEAMIAPTYNQSSKKYRISDSFTVPSEHWSYGQDDEDNNNTQDAHCKGNLYCELDGNNKTITLDGTAKVKIPDTYTSDGHAATYTEVETSHMLFTNITGSVHDLVLNLAKPLIATPATSSITPGKLNATDAIAPLAYAVRGSSAKVSNVKVKMADGAFVQAATPAGLVCWVNEGGTIEDCLVKGSVMSWVPNTGAYASDETADARRYAGGVVACAARATIKGCAYQPPQAQTGMAAPATLASADRSGKLQTYYGGILGAATVKDINGSREIPAVSIIDCTSQYQYTGVDDVVYHGAVVGTTVYTESRVNYNGTITTDPGMCQGNWWAQRGIGTVLNGMTIEDAIGRCNAVEPNPDFNY